MNTISKTTKTTPGNRWAILLSLAMVALVAELTLSDARADRWMFRRSYYSHSSPSNAYANFPRPRSRSAYRRAYIGANPGFSIRGGYRINRMVINSGNSSDVTYFRRDWYEIKP